MDNHYLNDDADRDGLTDYQEARIVLAPNKIVFF